MSDRLLCDTHCVDPLWCLQRRLCKACWDQAGEAIRQADEAAETMTAEVVKRDST